MGSKGDFCKTESIKLRSHRVNSFNRWKKYAWLLVQIHVKGMWSNGYLKANHQGQTLILDSAQGQSLIDPRLGNCQDVAYNILMDQEGSMVHPPTGLWCWSTTASWARPRQSVSLECLPLESWKTDEVKPVMAKNWENWSQRVTKASTVNAWGSLDLEKNLYSSALNQIPACNFKPCWGLTQQFSPWQTSTKA